MKILNHLFLIMLTLLPSLSQAKDATVVIGDMSYWGNYNTCFSNSSYSYYGVKMLYYADQIARRPHTRL